MKDYPQFFKSGRQDSFRAKLKNIGQPKQIRLLLEVTGKTDEEIRWHLDHVITNFEKKETHLLPSRLNSLIHKLYYIINFLVINGFIHRKKEFLI